MSSQKHIGDRVREMRLKRGWSQAVLADMCGVSQQSINTLEQRETDNPRSLLKLAEVLDVTPEWLSSGTEGITPDNFIAARQKREIMDTAIRLRDTREALGLSVTDICRQTGADPEKWSAWERGEAMPEIAVVMLMYRWYRITLDWIYLGVGHGLPSRILENLTDVDYRRRGLR
ncbi:MAG: XRE family transcriptional regulator [Rhodospirillaceae bacterium]|nr:MAG: XRE family transcriptional regulator [Rhodospirillaceae bacterium]